MVVASEVEMLNCTARTEYGGVAMQAFGGG
jgi:hypothetical protein